MTPEIVNPARTVETMRRGDTCDGKMMLDGVRERRRVWTRGKPLATCASWRLAHQGFTDPLNPEMDCIPASEL